MVLKLHYNGRTHLDFLAIFAKNQSSHSLVLGGTDRLSEQVLWKTNEAFKLWSIRLFRSFQKSLRYRKNKEVLSMAWRFWINSKTVFHFSVLYTCTLAPHYDLMKSMYSCLLHKNYAPTCNRLNGVNSKVCFVIISFRIFKFISFLNKRKKYAEGVQKKKHDKKQ